MKINNIKKIGYIIFHQLLVTIKEYNKDSLREGSYILCPNHTSDLDGPVLWTSNENIRIMAKKECFENKFIGKFLENLDVVSVDRSKHNGVEIMQAVRYLKNSDDKVFMMFPQGTISDINKNALSRVKPGAFVIASLSKKPIVPVFIEQPRFFRKSRVVYGDKFQPDILNDNGKIDREKLEAARAFWQQEIFRLQQQAIELESRPIRKIKLNKKHASNNLG
jgi:1-acyl-sn-glycerol-3-phosphate acyltransferase